MANNFCYFSILNRMRPVSLLFLYLSLATASFGQQPKLLLPVGHSALLTRAMFSPDGKIVATASGDEENMVKVWETRSGKLLYSLEGHTEKITSLSFSPDGKFILTTGHDHYARIWNVNTGLLSTAIRCQHSNWIDNGFFIKDGKEVVLVTADLFEDYETNTGKFLKAISDSALLKIRDASTLQRSQSIISTISPDKKWIATAHNDSTIKIWDVENRKLFKTFRNILTKSLDFSHDSRSIIVCPYAKSAAVIDFNTGKTICKISDDGKWFWLAVTSPDNKTLITRSEEHTSELQ